MKSPAALLAALALAAFLPAFPARAATAASDPLPAPPAAPAAAGPDAPAPPGPALSPPSFRQPVRDSYAVLKLGRFFPRGRDVGDLDDGFAGEIAFGRSFHPRLAAEFGIGYLKSSGGRPSAPFREIKIIPVTLSLKGTIPLKAVELYALAGIGGYYAKLASAAGPEGSAWTVGYQAGAGGRVDLGPIFLGVEGKYFRAEQDLGFVAKVRTDGLQGTIDVGIRY